MNNRQLLALAKKVVRLPEAMVTDKKTGEKNFSAYFVANPNAYKNASEAKADLARFGF